MGTGARGAHLPSLRVLWEVTSWGAGQGARMCPGQSWGGVVFLWAPHLSTTVASLGVLFLVLLLWPPLCSALEQVWEAKGKGPCVAMSQGG